MDKPLDQRKTIHLCVFMHSIERIDLKLSNLAKKYPASMNKNPELFHTIFHPGDVGLITYAREQDLEKGATQESSCGFTCKMLSNFGSFFEKDSNWTNAMDQSVKWHLTERPPQGESMLPPVHLIEKARPIDSDIEMELLKNLPTEPQAYKRNFIYDQRFTFGINSDSNPTNDFMNPSMGIFIVGHSNLETPVKEIVEKYRVKFNEGIPCSKTIAKYNMTNTGIYAQFRLDLLNAGIAPDELPLVSLSRFHSDPSRRPECVKINGIDHFNGIYLSHIIKDFTQFGNEHVNIMLYSCRGRVEEKADRIPLTNRENMSSIMKQSAEEKQQYKSFEEYGYPFVFKFMQKTGIMNPDLAVQKLKDTGYDFSRAVEDVENRKIIDKVVSEINTIGDNASRKLRSVSGLGGTRKIKRTRKRRKGRKTTRRKNKRSIKRRS
jgi:hypothetical protein